MTMYAVETDKMLEGGGENREGASTHLSLENREGLSTHLSLENKQIQDDEFDDLDEIFEHLDPKDGTSDGLIRKQIFLEWLDLLNFQDMVTLEAKHGIDRAKFRNLLDAADKDDNGYIDREEFRSLVNGYSTLLERTQRSHFLTYLRVAAYSQEYRWWPLPWFMICNSILLICLYSYTQTKAGLPVKHWLIYNPRRKYEVWRWFSYSLLHGNTTHIVLNLILMLMVGLPLEMTNNWWRVGIVYSSGVLFGSLVFSLTNPRAWLMGASGLLKQEFAEPNKLFLLNSLPDILLSLTLFLLSVLAYFIQ